MSSKDKSATSDLLSGPLWNKILIIALPMAFTEILQQLFNSADIAIVGNFVPDPAIATAAVAAIGSNSAIVSLLLTLFFGLSIGTTVAISQAVGQGNFESIHKTIGTSIILALVSGVVFAIGGQFLVNPVVSVMGVPTDVFDLAAEYLRFYLIALPFSFLYSFLTAIFRSVGNTRTPLIVLAFSGVVNVLLNIFFVRVMGMTVAGVAIATVISNALSCAILFIILCRTDSVVKIIPKNIRFYKESFNFILKIGLPAGIQGMVFAFSSICIQSAVNSLGTDVMAGSTAAFNLELFAYYILTGFGQATTTLVGQNFGAGQFERCQKSLRESLYLGIACFGFVMLILLVFGTQLVSLFNSNQDVIANGLIRLRFTLLGDLFQVVSEVLSGYLRGFGVSTPPAISTLILVSGVRIVWVFAIFPMVRTFTFLMAAYPISLVANMVALIIMFFYFRKRLKEKTEQMAALKG